MHEKRLTITDIKKEKWWTDEHIRMHSHIHVHTLGGHAPDILQSAMGAGETVMDYRHIWAVISRSHIPPAFSRRQKSCIMVSHRRPGTLGCIMPCQLVCVCVFVCVVITGFSTQRRIKKSFEHSILHAAFIIGKLICLISIYLTTANIRTRWIYFNLTTNHLKLTKSIYFLYLDLM